MLVDAVSARVGGGGTHAISQLGALARTPGIELTVHATGTIADLLAAAGVSSVVRVPARALPRRLAWEQLVLPFRARRHDVVYAIGNVALFLSPRPQVVAQQSAWYFSDPVRSFRRERCSRRGRARLAIEGAVVRASIRRATVAVAVSDSLQAAIEGDLGRRANLRVITSATPRTGPVEAPSRVLDPEPYALVVAHDDPHKEWDALVELFARHGELPQLKIVGRCTPERRIALEAVGGGRVDVLGLVGDPRTLQALYRGAVCSVAHSRFESFGLTPLEAIAAGTPVVAADIPAHREACGARVSYYAPEDLEALAELVAAVDGLPSGDSPNRTWDDNARELASVLREARR